MPLTIKEALISTVNFPIPEHRVEKALIDSELDGTAIYAKTDEKAIDLCMAGLLFTLLTSADITEGEWSQKLPSRDVILKVYGYLLQKWHEPNPLDLAKPTVKQVRIW